MWFKEIGESLSRQRGAWESFLKDFLKNIKNVPQNGKNDFVMGLISLYINRIFGLAIQQPKKAGKMWLRGKKAKELRLHKGEFVADCKTD